MRHEYALALAVEESTPIELDDLLALAAQDKPTELDDARARRAMRQISADREKLLRDGAKIISDVDLHDPLRKPRDEVRRIERTAELRKRGSITWTARNRRLRWSAEMSRIFGQAPAEARNSVKQLLELIHPVDRRMVRRQVQNAWQTRSTAEIVCRITKPDGSAGFIEFLIEITTDDAGRRTGIITTGVDITADYKRLREERRRALRDSTVQEGLAEVDAVTSLLTRRAFADELGRAARTGTGTLLVVSAQPYILRHPDRDPGHDDRLNAAAARVLRELADPDPCGRLGDHEFGVLLPYTTLETAGVRAGSIISGLRETRFLTGGSRLEAFGGLIPYDYRLPTESTDLLLDGETAWRRAKHEDRPVHVQRQAPSAVERREICRAGIRSTIRENRFALYAQPLRDLQLNHTTRQEILLRIIDDVGRPTSPATFLEVAEHVDEVLTVDRWVIDHALQTIGAWRPQTSHYQINISGQSLADPLLLNHLRSAIDRYQVDPERLTIEITETAAIGNLAVARRFADGVRELGCQLALDDFGTGNTPLSFLTKLPVDLVKIDGSFIQDLAHSEPHQAIVHGLVRMCRSLGILTAAEYVQDDATLRLLRNYGVDFAQGFHVGQPERLVIRRSQPVRSVELELYPPGLNNHRQVI